MKHEDRLIIGFYVFRLFRYGYFHVAIGLVYFQSVGLTLSQALSLESIYYLTKSVADIPGGYFADKVGRKSSLIIGSVMCAVSYGIIGIYDSYSMFAIAEVMLGIAMSLATTSDSALLYDELDAIGKKYFYEKAESRGWAIRNFSFGAASAIGAWISTKSNLGVPFIISSITLLLSVLIAIFCIKEPSFNPKNRKEPWLRSIVEVFKKRNFVYIVLFFALCFISVRLGFWAFQPILQYFNVPVLYFGILFGLALLVSLISAINLKWVKYFGPWLTLSLIITLCFFVIAIGTYLGGSIGIIIALFGFVLHSAAQGVYDPVMRQEINNLSSSSVRASTMAVATMFGNIGFAIIAPIYGWSIDEYGHAYTMVMSSVIIGALFILVLIPIYSASHSLTEVKKSEY